MYTSWKQVLFILLQSYLFLDNCRFTVRLVNLHWTRHQISFILSRFVLFNIHLEASRLALYVWLSSKEMLANVSLLRVQLKTSLWKFVLKNWETVTMFSVLCECKHHWIPHWALMGRVIQEWATPKLECCFALVLLLFCSQFQQECSSFNTVVQQQSGVWLLWITVKVPGETDMQPDINQRHKFLT